jgi:hypothetical protein
MDRRSLLKTLAISPFFALGNRSIIPVARPFATDIYLFLHGFFFLEYQGNRLIITAPAVDDHDYKIGQPDKKLLKDVPPNTTFDWTGDLTGDDQCSAKAFPKQILQFSKGDTGIGDSTGSFHFKLILPCPLHIYSLRLGKAKDFPGRDGHVWNSIQKHLTDKIALVTCLQFQGTVDSYWPSSSSTPYRCHVYAEPHCKTDLEHTRHALIDCRRLFANPTLFDLDIDVGAMLDPVYATDPHNDDPGLTGFSASDENNLAEVLQSNECHDKRAVNVANCGQYGIVNP